MPMVCRYPLNLSGNWGYEKTLKRENFYSHYLNCHKQSTVNIFVDASVRNGSVAIAAVQSTESLTLALDPTTSSRNAELTAILLGLFLVKNCDYDKFTIFSDYYFGLVAIESQDRSNELVNKILNFVENFKNNETRPKYVSFCHVPAHVGVTGNERADEMAKNKTKKI